MNIKKIITFIIILFCFIFISCESEDEMSANDYLNSAWENIAIGHYQTAETNLKKAKGGNIDNINLATGWIKLGQDSIARAKIYLTNITIPEDFTNEYIAGELLLLFLDKQYDLFLSKSNDLSSSWVHSCLNNFSSNSIISLRALVYFERKKYSSSLLEIQKIDSTYTINLDNITQFEGSVSRSNMFQKISDLF